MFPPMVTDSPLVTAATVDGRDSIAGSRSRATAGSPQGVHPVGSKAFMGSTATSAAGRERYRSAW
ncbi:hypothetical protein GCM10010359_07320 [Streptomyces morookaense]|nr:hypothetical protein GCM10010359_07320 [Streptomyces morookaense]